MIDSKKRYILPSAPAVIDPKQDDCMYPYKNICGAVVALRVVEALFDAIGEQTDDLEELRELAGFATVCDVMELKDENRVLVKNTLKNLKNSKNVGMRALINATGRLDSADLSLELLQCSTIEDAIVIANELKMLNENRKALTEQGLIKALKIIDDEHIFEQKVMVVYMPDLHESLAGIVAGRIKEKYKKPVFVITGTDKTLKGSARSIPAYHIYEAMTKISDLFEKFGGHAMAAGFSLPKENLDEFRKRINDNCSLNEDDYEEKIVIDVPMPMRYVTSSLIEQLSCLEPFGLGNEKPIFAEKDVELLSCRLMGSMQDMARFSVRTKDGFKAEMIVFRNANDMLFAIEKKYGSNAFKELMESRAKGILMDVIYYPSINEYQGRKTIQFVVGDYK